MHPPRTSLTTRSISQLALTMFQILILISLPVCLIRAQPRQQVNQRMFGSGINNRRPQPFAEVFGTSRGAFARQNATQFHAGQPLLNNQQINAQSRLRPPQWAPTNGPETGQVISMLVKGSRVFAGTSGGVFVSDDNGQSWQISNNGFDGAVYELMAIDNVILAGTDPFGGKRHAIYRSIDNGATWQPSDEGLPQPAIGRDLITIGSTVIAVIGDENFSSFTTYRSVDKGKTWQLSNQGLPDVFYFLFAKSNNPGTGSVLLGTTNQGLVRSADSGLTWESVDPGLPAGGQLNQFSVDAAFGTRFLIPTLGGGVYGSDDGGKTWQPSNTGLPEGSSISVVRAAGNVVYCTAFDDGGLYYSTDGGRTWKLRSPEFLIGRFFNNIYQAGSGLLALTGDGIIRSTDQGVTWNRSNKGLHAAEARSLLAAGRLLYTAAQGGIWVSHNKGQSWSLLNNGFRRFPNSDPNGTAICLKEGNLFAGILFDGLYRSTNGGASWNLLTNGLPENDIIQTIRSVGSKLFACYIFNGTFSSQDNGETWKKVETLPADVGLASLTGYGALMFAASYGAGVFRSDDFGETWYEFSNGLRTPYIDDFSVYRNVVIVGTDAGLYRLKDDGTGWSELTAYAQTVTGGCDSLRRFGKTLFASTYGRGIWASTNDGESWFKVNGGMTTSRAYDFAVLDDTLFVGTAGNGVFLLRDYVSRDR